MPLSSCDDERLELAQTAQNKLSDARKLVQTQEYALALECYLFAFDNSLAVSGWGGVRLSYIPSEIAKLGEKYPPAKIALQVRRDAREELILKGETDFNVLSEWSSINGYLNELDRELLVMNELSKKGILGKSVRERIVRDNFDGLLRDKNYKLLSDYFDDFGNSFLNTIMHYELARIFPEERNRGAMTDYYLREIPKEGAKILELAFGLGKKEQANAIVERIVQINSSTETYRLLIDAANRAGKKQMARRLMKQAKTNFGKDEYGNDQS